jgi:hypothetical protein
MLESARLGAWRVSRALQSGLRMGRRDASASAVAVRVGDHSLRVAAGGLVPLVPLVPFVSFALLCSLTFLVHCSLVTSLDGLSGGSIDAGANAVSSFPDAEGVDAGSPAASGAGAVDATVEDAPSQPAPSGPDAGARDAGTDAGADAGADADSSTLLFADDFEGSQPLPRGWDVMATSDGTLALDTTLFVSPTTSLSATALPLAAGAAGNAADVAVRRAFPIPSAGTTVAYDFEVYPKQCDPSANMVFGALQLSDGAGDLYELQLDAQLTAAGALTLIFAEYTALLDGGSIYVGHPFAPTLAVAAWTRVRIELTTSQPPVAHVFLNGALALETSVAIPIEAATVQLSLGISYVSAPSGTWVFNYDDAALWSSP